MKKMNIQDRGNNPSLTSCTDVIMEIGFQDINDLSHLTALFQPRVRGAGYARKMRTSSTSIKSWTFDKEMAVNPKRHRVNIILVAWN